MSWAPLFWFVVVLALIPLALWLLKRSPLTPLTQGMRVIASSHLGPGQRLLTVEVGEGASRRWLLLGATAHHISLLTELPAQDVPVAEPPSFAKLLRRQGSA